MKSFDFNDLYIKCLDLADLYSMELSKVDRKKTVPKRYQDFIPESISYSSPKEKLHSVFVETIECLISEIKTRFPIENLKIVSSLSKLIDVNDSTDVVEEISLLKSSCFFNDILNFDALENELILWKEFTRDDEKKELNSLLSLFKKNNLRDDFP